jgi:hypothetical protein
MLRRVAFLRTNVSKEHSTSAFKVTKIDHLFVTLMVEVLSSFETSILTRATRRNIPEDGILQSHRRENLKSYNAIPDSSLRC